MTAAPAALGRILKAADFERVLQTSSRARSHWFALHHLVGSPSRTVPNSLSTAHAPDGHRVVDEPDGHWLGLVVPKRLARRSVTRTLVKRLGRAGLSDQLRSETPLPAGLWVLRLRTPIDKKQFPSAASDPLRTALRDDLQLLWKRALNPKPPRPPKAAA